jgi:hypothetical protein
VKLVPWRDLIEHGATLSFAIDEERPYFAVEVTGADMALADERAIDARTWLRCFRRARRRSSRAPPAD